MMSAPSTPRDLAWVMEGYRRAEKVTRAHGTTYYWGARLLPRQSRRHVYALYAMARTADDIVDSTGPEARAAASSALTAYESAFYDARRDRGCVDPVLAAAAQSAHACGLADDCFARFFAAMRSDLTVSSYATWQDLLGYMDGSAAVIGEMMLPVLRPIASALPAARALGLAFQLTNFLRDVAEDLDRGRVYLPQEDLDHFGADPQAAVVDDAWRALMRFQIERNRRLYRAADEGITDLPLASRRCVVAARLLYARILDVIEDADYDVFSRRARVPTHTKAALAARAATTRRPERLLPQPAIARIRDAWPDDDQVVLLDGAGAATGTAAKSQVHHDDTPRHLGFSCYVLDQHRRVLATVRATSKTSFPGVATNSACGHPRPGEAVEDAARRRLRHELGLTVGEVRVVLPAFTYRARTDLLKENEACPVLVAEAIHDDPGRGADEAVVLDLDPVEVETAWWVEWKHLREMALRQRATLVSPDGRRWPLSPWCTEQVRTLHALGPDPLAWAEDRNGLPPALCGTEESGV